MLTLRDELLRLLVSGDARLIDVRVEVETTIVTFDVWDTEASEELVIATFRGDHASVLREALGGCVLDLECRSTDPRQAIKPATGP